MAKAYTISLERWDDSLIIKIVHHQRDINRADFLQIVDDLTKIIETLSEPAILVGEYANGLTVRGIDMPSMIQYAIPFVNHANLKLMILIDIGKLMEFFISGANRLAEARQIRFKFRHVANIAAAKELIKQLNNGELK